MGADYVEGRCPVNVTSVPYLDSAGYSENLAVHVWLKASGTQSCRTAGKPPSANVKNWSVLCLFPLPDFDKSPKIEISPEHQVKAIYPYTKTKTKVRSCILMTPLWGDGSKGGVEVEKRCHLSFSVLSSLCCQKKGQKNSVWCPPHFNLVRWQSLYFFLSIISMKCTN